MAYHLYIIFSKSRNRYYIGHTNSLIRRLKEHNTGQSKSTRYGVPWNLVYSKQFDSSLEANREELKLKKMKSRKFIERLIAFG
ncbi:GIY-YIG nuclease family protein [bacterium]|nr:GIY-YIG nuclease family protein [bacterium]